MTYQKIHKELKSKIKKDYGKPCEHFCITCYCCLAYLMLDILEDITSYR